ncbi:MAG: hypothetical protein HN790_14185 [Methylococcales bacterium]|jgi:S-sulfosulfanyl-L-cysteine sulfohydrolase|nr:hypothetical protein [Methylococcales bacterium]
MNQKLTKIIRLLTFSLCVCSSGSVVAKSTVTFMHLNDLHANLVPHNDLVQNVDKPGTEYVERGGLARTATLIKKIRQNNPNSVLMNIGDTYHGGVEAVFTSGEAIIDPVNALGIDVGVAGNWDFAFGPKVTRERYGQSVMSFFKKGKRPNFPNLAANVTYSAPFFKKGKPFMPATMLPQVGDVSVGFIGITSDIVPQMASFLALGLEFAEGEAAYLKLIEQHSAELRAKGADIVVVMSELGLQKDVRLANLVTPNSVDVFFSAHTHETTFEPIQSESGALVVESGNDGYLGQMDIVVDDEHIVIARNWTLHAIDHRLAEDPAMKALVAKARAPFLADDVNMTAGLMQGMQTLTQPINTVIGRTKAPMTRRHSLESDFNNALTDILRDMTGTDVAMTKGFRFESVIPEVGAKTEQDHVATGDITLEDVYRFFPTAYQFATATTTPARLKSIIEEGLTNTYSADVFKQNGGWFEGFSGLNLVLDLTAKDGERVLAMLIDGLNSTVDDVAEITVTGCVRPIESAGIMCDFNGFNDVERLINPDTGAAWSNIELFVKAVQEQRLPIQTRRTVEDVSETPLWPIADFIQPVNGVQ